MKVQLLFLLLLRLSPPLTREQPYSLRIPTSTTQSPNTAQLHPEQALTSPPNSPSRYTSHHLRDQSQHTTLSSSYNAQLQSIDAFEPDDPVEDFASDSASSISESSIIDLPPALSPSRIIPPKSLSMNRGLNFAALDESPVLGPILRRTRSARYVARVLSSRTFGEGELERRPEQDGYGTFGTLA